MNCLTSFKLGSILLWIHNSKNLKIASSGLRFGWPARIMKFYHRIYVMLKRIKEILFNKISLYSGKTNFSIILLSTPNLTYYNMILYLLIAVILIGIYWYIKSREVYLRNKIYSINNFSLLDILYFLLRFKYIISAFIFIIYIVNAMNGLNIDYKGILEVFNSLSEEGRFINAMNSYFGIGMHYLGDIDGGVKYNNNSMSNKIFAAINNNENNNSNNNGHSNSQNGNNTDQDNNSHNQNGNDLNQDEGPVSPVSVDSMPDVWPSIEGAYETSPEPELEKSDLSSDEGEKEPNEANGNNPHFSQREAKIDELKQKRKWLRSEADDDTAIRNEQLREAYSKLKKARIYEETETIAPTHVPEPKSLSKRTWIDRESDSDSDNDNKSRIITNPVNDEPQTVKKRKALFRSAKDKAEFQEALKVVKEKSQEISKALQRHNRIGERLDNLDANYDAKMRRLTRGFDNVNSNNKNNNN